MSNKPVRVRFAPSPTGSLHIGGARTALFNWLFARHHGGKFVLRIEDTDQKRSVEGAIEEIQNGLRWLGLEWDEGPDKGGDFGPYIQSERHNLYQKWANWLVEQGKAYRCYATPEELQRAKGIAQKSKSGKLAGYERIHRFISDEERAKIEAERESYVIRLAMPLEGETVVHEALRGTIRFPNDELSDIVLLKGDGFPTYHLAMAVDDHFMEISHVMRSDEWTPSLPMHQQLYDAFGWDTPTFVHLPVILNPNGKGKLSKRDQSFKDGKFNVLVQVKEYIEAGYQPEAVVNWLTNTGWSFGDDREIFTTAETIERFTIDRLNPAPSALPFSKLANINGHYIRQMALADFISAIRPHLEAAYGQLDEDRLRSIAPHLQERVNPLPQAVEMAAFLFVNDFQTPDAETLIQKKMDAAGTIQALERAIEILQSLPDFAASTQEEPIRALLDELGLKPGQLFNTIRWAVTAQQASPPLFESLEALGKAEAIARLQAAVERLKTA